jgi:hypothetical protein
MLAGVVNSLAEQLERYCPLLLTTAHGSVIVRTDASLKVRLSLHSRFRLIGGPDHVPKNGIRVTHHQRSILLTTASFARIATRFSKRSSEQLSRSVLCWMSWQVTSPFELAFFRPQHVRLFLRMKHLHDERGQQARRHQLATINAMLHLKSETHRLNGNGL